jgi:AsmA protein
VDVNTGKQFKISKMKLSTQAINQGQPLPVELKALVESNQPEWMAAIHAKAKLEFNDDAAVFEANGLKMSAKALLPGTEMGKVTIAMVADSAINLQTQTAKLSKARLSAFGLVAGGAFDVENIFSVPVIQGPIKVKTFEMATLAKHLKFDMPQMANAQSLNQISLKALFKTDFDTVQLDDIAAKVDASRVQGFVHIAAKSQPEVRYELKADKINLDDYRLAGNAADKDKLPLPLDFIRAADLEGVLDVETAMLDEIELKQLHIASNIENGILKINPITMRVSDAEVKAAVQLDAREIPAVILTAEVRQVDASDSINPLLNNIMGDQAPTLKGLVNANANLNATGSSVAALKTSAKGTVQLAMDETTVTGIDFDHASQAVVVDYAERNDFKVSRTFNAEYVPDSATEFNRLSASFKLSKGRLVNKDLLMESDKVNVTGSGSIDFINAKLDYRPVIDMNMKSTVNVRDKLRDHPMQYHTHGRFGDLITEFDVALYDLHMGRLMIQEAKAHTNRRINSQSQNNWQNALSK